MSGTGESEMRARSVRFCSWNDASGNAAVAALRSALWIRDQVAQHHRCHDPRRTGEVRRRADRVQTAAGLPGVELVPAAQIADTRLNDPADHATATACRLQAEPSAAGKRGAVAGLRSLQLV